MCSHSYSQLFVLVLFGVIVGAIYYKVKRDDKGIQNRSVLFFVLCFSLLPRLFNASAISYWRYKRKTQVEHVSLISLYRR